MEDADLARRHHPLLIALLTSSAFAVACATLPEPAPPDAVSAAGPTIEPAPPPPVRREITAGIELPVDALPDFYALPETPPDLLSRAGRASARRGRRTRSRPVGNRAHVDAHPDLAPADVGHTLATARADLETFMERLVLEGDRWYTHDLEGPDDATSHIRAMLTDTSLSIPVDEGDLSLGTWQGIFLCEFRNSGGSRKLVLTAIGV